VGLEHGKKEERNVAMALSSVTSGIVPSVNVVGGGVVSREVGKPCAADLVFDILGLGDDNDNEE
jgi:hypothetical protein